MKCPECNSEVGRDWLICPNCGLDLSAAEDDSQVTDTQLMVGRSSSTIHPKKVPGNFPKYLLGSLFVLLMLGGGVWLSSLKINKEPVPTSTKMISPSNTKIPKKSPTSVASATYPPLPQFTVRHYDGSRDGNLPVIWSGEYIPNFAWPTSPGTYKWGLDYPSNTPVWVYYAWCTLGRDILDQNLSVIEFSFLFDGYDITRELEISEGSSQMEGENWVCQNYTAVIENIDSGRHTFVYVHHFLEDLNDGKYDFKKGVYEYNFFINVR